MRSTSRWITLAMALCAAVMASMTVAEGSPAEDFASAGEETASTSEPSASSGGRLDGIDVSHWNGKIDWERVRADGYRFAIAKATQGRGYEDPTYDVNHAHAREAGLRFTAYEFADPDPGPKDARRDADHFVNVANLRGKDLVPVLDLEQTGGLGPTRLIEWVRRWSGRVKERIGRWPTIYTSPSFWKQHMKDSGAFAKRGNRLWIAHWFADRPDVPADRWNGRGWAFWQWSNRGEVRGIEGRVDLNLFAGSSLKKLMLGN